MDWAEARGPSRALGLGAGRRRASGRACEAVVIGTDWTTPATYHVAGGGGVGVSVSCGSLHRPLY